MPPRLADLGILFESCCAGHGRDVVADALSGKVLVLTDREANVRSARLPGGDLVSAVLDRTVMSLADRGGASNLVGARWADVAAAWVAGWIGQARQDPTRDDRTLVVERVARLDDEPRIAAIASKHGKQNPDLLLILQTGSGRAVQAADAKFSVETARSKQVSPEVVAGLLSLGPVVTDVLGEIGNEFDVLPGIFLSPDYLLTHLMLEHRQGILKATVSRSEVALVPIDAGSFFGGMEGAGAMRLLARHDAIRTSPETNALAGLYYIRLARAAIGIWFDATKPLLGYQDALVVDEAAVERDLERHLSLAPSSYQVIRRWHEEVEAIRTQRSAVEQVAGLPVPNRDLRAQIERLAASNGLTPPSVNQVRRRLGAWYRQQLRDEVGPVPPPVPDLVPVLEQVAAAGAKLTPQLGPELERIVLAIGRAEQEPAVAELTTS